jgi:hypothetical protein
MIPQRLWGKKRRKPPKEVAETEIAINHQIHKIVKLLVPVVAVGHISAVVN